MDLGNTLITVLGGMSGGLLRLAPEAFKLFDRHNERKHELALGEQQAKLLQLQSNTRLDEVRTQSEATQAAQALQALSDSIKAQATPTGIKWVDALSALVRPFWTFLVLGMWASVKVVDVAFATARNLPWEEMRPVVWSAEDAGMLATLATFWFLDRVIRKQQGR
jgi:hypothetical protein